MVVNLFDEVSPTFFMPLAGGNRQLNYELLHLINEKMHNDIEQFSREQVMEWLVEYLSHSSYDESLDDETQERSTGQETYQDIASRKLHYFKQCGWLSTEVDNEFRTTYQMDSFAIVVLQAIDSYLSNNEDTIQLTHFVYSIYMTLKNGFQMDHAVDAVQTIADNEQKLSDMLRSLNSNVRKYLNKLLHDENASPQEILYTLLSDYQNSVVLKSFENLRRRDNPSRYKQEIIAQIDNLLANHLSEMVDNAIAVTYGGEDSPENRRAAQFDFQKKLGETRKLFETIEDQIRVINQRNTRYVRTTESRLSYLLNEDRNLEGRITSLLKGIESSDYEKPVNFGISIAGVINTESLFRPRVPLKKSISRTPVSPEKIDPEELEAHSMRLQRAMEFSLSYVDSFILSALGVRSSMLASEVSLASEDDFLRLLLAELYSTSPLVHYRAKLRDSDFTFQGRTMTDFVIEKRG